MSTESQRRLESEDTVQLFRRQPKDQHPAVTTEGRFLAGSRSRLTELGRAWKIFAEIIKGFRSLHFVGPCVTVFGSARFEEDHRYYQLAREMGSRLAKAGFVVMTGGGPGIMEAAGRGAQEGGGRSVGCAIRLPMEDGPNPYVDHWVEFDHFFVRKLMLIKYSYAFVVMPGGVGTLDEIFETATLIQTGKIENFPIVLMGTDYWRPLVGYMRDTMLAEGTISPHDVDRLLVTDSYDEAVHHIAETATERFGLRWEPVIRPRKIFGEGRIQRPQATGSRGKDAAARSAESP